MFNYGRRGRFLPLIGLSLAGLAACGPSAEIQQQLAELTAISAEKDSLMTQVAANARLMSDISAELARAQIPVVEEGATETSAPQDPARILANIQTLTARITESEDRLAESQKRVEALSRESRSQTGRIAEFQKTIDEFRGTIESQKATIASLTDQVALLQEENTRLATVNVQLADTLSALDNRQNSVWYLIGTRQELLERGIISEEGGSRVLFVFGKRGKTMIPGRDLDLSQFNVADLRYLTEIPLPDPAAQYTIVTRQDFTALETPPDDKARVRGDFIRITDPARFWAGDHVLILVRN